MSRSYTLGPTGTIPQDEYLRKIQSSGVPEDPEQVETYLRAQLSDFRPDAPFFESDQPRDPSDRGSGYGSREALNLRYSGARSDALPYLPDGTFLDHEFMERDPRGTQNVPLFSKYKAQGMARSPYYNFGKDADWSVPETGVNPVQMVAKIRNAQQQVKDRLQIFDESMDSWSTPSAAVRGPTSAVAMVTADGTIVNLAEATARQRRDPVNVLSNRYPLVNRHSEPDQRVKISKYGQIRPVMDIGANDWSTNRYNAYMDHQIPMQIDGQMVNRMLGHLILSISGQQATKQLVAQGADYSESEVNQLRRSRRQIDPDDLYKVMMIGGVSHSISAQQENFEETPVRLQGRMRTFDLHKTRDLASLNHKILRSMEQVSRKLGPQKHKDLRDSIKQSAADYGLYTEQTQRPTHKQKVDSTLNRESLDIRQIEEEKVVKQYGGLLPMTYRPRLDTYEGYKTSSRETRARAHGRLTHGPQQIDDFEADQDITEFALPGRKKAVDPKKHRGLGRSLQAEDGDIETGDSTGTFDIKDVLAEIIKDRTGE